MNRVVFTSLSDEWRTPASVYASLNAEFAFRFDPCPMDDQSPWDGLHLPWQFPAFVNPPYSAIAKWVEKAYREAERGTVVMLIPSRTDTRWWHEFVMKADEIRFVKGRLKFGTAKHNAPFPSCVVVFRARTTPPG